jgi:hypothetical protein
VYTVLECIYIMFTHNKTLKYLEQGGNYIRQSETNGRADAVEVNNYDQRSQTITRLIQRSYKSEPQRETN